jgi:hypothetical protein
MVKITAVTVEMAEFSDNTLLMRQKAGQETRPNQALKGIYKYLIVQDFVDVFRKDSTMEQIIERLQDPNRRWGVDGVVENPEVIVSNESFAHKVGNARNLSADNVSVKNNAFVFAETIEGGNYKVVKTVDLKKNKILALQIQLV